MYARADRQLLEGLGYRRLITPERQRDRLDGEAMSGEGARDLAQVGGRGGVVTDRDDGQPREVAEVPSGRLDL
jgi:hypothetical protein